MPSAMRLVLTKNSAPPRAAAFRRYIVAARITFMPPAASFLSEVTKGVPRSGAGHFWPQPQK